MHLRSLLLTALLCACRRGESVNRTASDSQPSLQPPAQIADSYPSVDDARLTIGQLRLGLTEAEGRRLLGEPSSKSEPHNEEVLADPTWKLVYPDVTIDFTGSRATRISCMGQACVTPDSIRMGDSRARVERAYGPGRYDPIGESLTYFARRSDCALTFVFFSDRVGTIKLSCDQT